MISLNKDTKELKKKVRKVDEKMVKILSLEDIEIDESLVGLEGSPTWVVNISVDEGALNFLRVDSSLSAVERIKVICCSRCCFDALSCILSYGLLPYLLFLEQQLFFCNHMMERPWQYQLFYPE